MNKLIGVILLVFILYFSNSCIKNVDFEQIDELELSTPFDIPLIYFNKTQNDFLDNTNTEIISISNTTEVKIGKVILDNIQGVITYETISTNQFDRNFSVKFTFLDESSQELFSKEISIPAQANNLHQNIIIQGSDLELFRLMKKVKTTIVMQTGIPIQPTVNRNLSLQSALHFNYNYSI